MKIHKFRESLKKANNPKFETLWLHVYKEIFVDFESMSEPVLDLTLQRAGVDRFVTLKNGRILNCQEKLRFVKADYGDVLLETVSVDTKGTPGWIERADLAIDYLVVASLHNRKALALPWPFLRTAWVNHRAEWATKKATKVARNAGYSTISVAVPTDRLLAAISAVGTLAALPADLCLNLVTPS